MLMNSRTCKKFFFILLLIIYSLFIVGCTDSSDSDEITFQNLFDDALDELKNQSSYNIVVQMSRDRREYGSNYSFLESEYTFFNNSSIFAYDEKLENFYEHIDDTNYMYYQGDTEYFQTLAYTTMDDWTSIGFLPVLQVDQYTLDDSNDQVYQFNFSVNAGVFLEDNPCYLFFLLTLDYSTLKDEVDYDLSDINFDVTACFDQSTRAILSISFDTVAYLNEVLIPNEGFNPYLNALVLFKYEYNPTTYDTNVLDTYGLDDYPNYASIEADRTFIELNIPKSINFEYDRDSDVLSFNVTQSGTYHIEINSEYSLGLHLHDVDHQFIGYYNLEPGYELVLDAGIYDLTFFNRARIGIFEILITQVE